MIITKSGFDEIRDTLQQRGERLRHLKDSSKRIDFDRFFGATDSMLESSMAASAYEGAFSENIGIKILNCYGFLQSLFVMQDAVRSITVAVCQKDFDIWSNPNLAKIRAARNRISGHPAYADKEKSDGRGISSAFFPFHDIKKYEFRAHLYLSEKSEDIIVAVDEWRTMNKSELVKQLMVVMSHFSEIDMEIRKRSFE